MEPEDDGDFADADLSGCGPPSGGANPGDWDGGDWDGDYGDFFPDYLTE